MAKAKITLPYWAPPIFLLCQWVIEFKSQGNTNPYNKLSGQNLGVRSSQNVESSFLNTHIQLLLCHVESTSTIRPQSDPSPCMTTPTEARIISPTGRLQASLPGSTLRWSLQSILHQNNEICNWGHNPPTTTTLKLSKSFLFHLEWNPDSVPWEKTLQDLAPPPSPASVHPFIHTVLQTNLASALGIGLCHCCGLNTLPADLPGLIPPCHHSDLKCHLL